jgi:hypothetical protein
MTEDTELVEEVDGLPDGGAPDVKTEPVPEPAASETDPEAEAAAGTEA